MTETRVARAVGRAITIVIVLLLLPFSPTGVASGAADGHEPPVFSPMESTSLGMSTVLGGVKSDGNGTMHAVVRSDQGGQQILYRRSTDGGHSWRIAGRFAGPQGATDPVLAVSGKNVLIAFRSIWCRTQFECAESVYITVSGDAGETWIPPLLVGVSAHGARVAVDGNRWWMAWNDYTGHARVTTWTTNPTTAAVTRTYPGSVIGLSASGGTVGLALWRYQASSVVVVSEDTPRELVWNDPVPLPTGLGYATFNDPIAVAAAHVHVVLAPPAQDLRPREPRDLYVWTGDATGYFDPAIGVMEVGHAAAVAANSLSLGVAAVGYDGVTRMVTSSDSGLTFSPPVEIARRSGMLDGGVILAASVEPPRDGPRARFDWSVPRTFVDVDGDGWPDPENRSGDSAVDRARVEANGTLPVALDGCASAPGDTARLVRWEWWIDGSLWRSSDRCDGLTYPVDSGVSLSISLVVEDALGRRAEVAQEVSPRNLLVVSLGDSIASGEGVPMPDGVWFTWQNRTCHRSALAGPAQAAAHIELADPHTSVTFLHLACSGAAMLDTSMFGVEPLPYDDPGTGGLLDEYHGIAEPYVLQRPQVEQLRGLIGDRKPDAVLVSIGANDTRFSDVIKGCVVNPYPCNDPDGLIRILHEARWRDLPTRYALLASTFAGLGVRPSTVFLTEYFDQTSDDRGRPNLRCVEVHGVAGLINDDEARWAAEEVGPLLNAAGRTAAARHGWHYVGDIAARFDRHGHCATDRWAVTIPQSKAQQGGEDGAFHPNMLGHLVYADRIVDALRHAVLPPPPGEPRGRPVELGDFVALTTSRHIGLTEQAVVASSVGADGAAPVLRGVRVVDTMRKGGSAQGLLGAWDVAVDGASAVVSWAEADSFDIQRLTTRLGVLATRTNVGITDVAVVQAPHDGRFLVADRPALLLAEVLGQVTETTHVPVNIVVEAIDERGRPTVVYDDHEMLEVKPGRHKVVLPKGTSTRIVLPEGTRPLVTVTIEDPPGASRGSADDNRFVLEDARGPLAVPTRILSVILGRLITASGTPTCAEVRQTARVHVAFAADTMPVAADGLDANLACDRIGLIGDDEPSIIRGLLRLDETAFWAGLDSVAGVTPPGALASRLGGAEGIGAVGVRAVMIEHLSARQGLAHELSHGFGIDHTDQVRAEGVRVATAQHRTGVDWMERVGTEKVWTGGATWDALVQLIGTDGPAVPFRTWPGVYVRGVVVRNDDGTHGIEPGTWIPARAPGELVPPPPPEYPDDYFTDPAEFDLEPVTVQQYDAGGQPVGPRSPVALRPVSGLGSDHRLDGAILSERVVLDPTATSLALLEGERVVVERAIGEAPTVAVTAPTAGTEVARGADLTVTWTAADADSPTEDLTARVLLSSDGGAHWQPFGEVVSGSSLTAPLPASIGGDAVIARVIVSDGLRFGQADSQPFDAEPTPDEAAEDRVVFQRRGQDLGYPEEGYDPHCTSNCAFPPLAGRIWTMRTDGSDPVQIPLPEESAYSALDISRRPGDATCDRESSSYRCVPEYATPRLSPDGRKVAFRATNLFLPEWGGKGIADPEEPQTGDYSVGTIWVANLDGTGLERVSRSTADGAWWGHDWGRETVQGVDNDCPSLSPDGNSIAWRAMPYGLVISRRVPGGWSPPERLITFAEPPLVGDPHTTGTRIPLASLPAGWHPPAEGQTTARILMRPWDRRGACPVWSPDGSTLAFAGTVEYRGAPVPEAGTTDPLLVFMQAVLVVPTTSPVDGSRARVVTPPPVGSWSSANYRYDPYNHDQRWATEWLSSTQLVVDGLFRETDGTPARQVRRFDLASGSSALLYAPSPGAPAGLRRASDGRFHGLASAFRWRDGSCTDSQGAASLADAGWFTTVDPADDSVTATPPADEPAGVFPDRSSGPCRTLLDQFSLGIVPTTGTAEIPPLVTYDLASEPPPDDPDDLPDPPTPDVDEIAVPDPDAPGVDGPMVGAPRATSLRVTLRTGVSTSVRLGPAGDVPLRFEIRTPPPPGELGVASGSLDVLGRAVTGLDGVVVLTPAAGFSGTTSFTYSAVGSAELATVEVEVQPAPVVRTVDDEFEGRVGEELVLSADDLLGNDLAPDDDGSGPLVTTLRTRAAASLGLELLSAERADNGWVELDRDGLIHVWPAREGVATFRYVVAAGDALGEGLVTIRVASAGAGGGTDGGGTGSSGGDGGGDGEPVTDPPPLQPGGPGGGGADPDGSLPSVSPGRADAGGLAVTGADVVRTSLLGAALVGVGLVMLRRPQRRRDPSTVGARLPES